MGEAHVDDGLVEGATSGEQAELVALRRRARVLEVEMLRRATLYYAKDAAPKCRSRGSVTLPSTGSPATVTCRVLGCSTQAYYRWLADPVCHRDWEDAHLLNAIIDVHRDNPAFGYRFIADEVHRLGHAGSENRIQRLGSLQQKTACTVRRRRGSVNRPGPALADDVLRDFTAERPNQA